ncbi:ATP-binding protein [Salicola sp. Rm-C-2C1-2]|uniref:ATP-binding protein n=1 Tax=Salicola sp. Rm-C-2C1-2 TaxID=3141321 RepID=UPI0032E46340
MEASPTAVRKDQRARLFRVYNYYRIAVSLLLVALLLLETDLVGTTLRDEWLFQATALAYLAMNIVTGMLLLAGYILRPWHITVSILTDILMIHLLAFFSGGISSGIVNLVIISVAAGNILIPGRIGTFYAALATLASLVTATLLMLQDLSGVDTIVRAGVMGGIYFAAAFLLQNITRRLASSEQLASERARSIEELEHLNHQIIQRMHTGILVAEPNGAIRLANAASGELLLGERGASPRLTTLPQPLKQRLDQWLEQPGERTPPFQARNDTPSVQANFMRLDSPLEHLILIFLEDTGKITQQAQQMKLASLGRLTAGIAHEIRNPLGAISHAAQLLGESSSTNEGDRRMAGIIQRHSERVNTIIENVLELSRRRSTSVRLMDLGEWLAHVVNDYVETVQEPVLIDLKLSGSPGSARFDPSQLQQALTNLIDNGLRYSQKRTGRPQLTVRTGVTDDGQRAYIDVWDYGPGLSDSQQASLFEPFQTTEQEGTGLGLYLARELCEANQARLFLLESGTEGCCFRITFAHPGRRALDFSASGANLIGNE